MSEPEIAPSDAEGVRRYQGAHDRHEADVALATFTAHATVIDGHDCHGSEQIRVWLKKTSTAFSYTRTLVGEVASGADSWLVVNHLDGNFPGGIVDLRYRFVVSGALLSALVRAP